MAKMLHVFLVMFLVLSAHPLRCEGQMWEAAGAVAGGAAMFFGAPVVLGAMGFGSTIGAGTLAAKAMSLAWSTGYGSAVIAGLQSAGAAGVGAASVITGAVFGAGTAHYGKEYVGKEKDKKD